MNVPFLKEAPHGVYLAVKLQPRASRQQVCGVQGAELKVSVTAPPVDSAANQALVEFMAEVLQVSRSAVELVRGHTSRHKTLFVHGVSGATAQERLAAHFS